MKIASWNVNSLNVRRPHLQQWLGQCQPDIVALQETKLEDHKFPDSELAELGYRSVFAGQNTYNGVAIVSRSPASDVQVGIPGRSEEHTSELQSLMRISYAVFCLKKRIPYSTLHKHSTQ